MPPPNSASHETPLLSPSTPAADQPSQSLSTPDYPFPHPAEDGNAHDENVNFLRSRPPLYNPLLPSLSRHRRRRYQTSQPRSMEEGGSPDRMDLDDPNELRLLIEINRRIPTASPRDEPHTMPNYEGRRSDSRALYGWAPGSDDEDDSHRRSQEPVPEQIQPLLHTVPDRIMSSSTHRQRRQDATGRTPPIISGEDSSRGASQIRSSSRSAGDLSIQSMRDHSRSPRDRTLESYLWEWQNLRSNGASDGNEQPEPSSSSRAYRNRDHDRQRTIFQSHLRARARAYQRYRAEASGDILLKDAINYLDRLRYSNSFEESISSAAASFASLDRVSWKDSDFIFDTNTIAPPATCSWLRPGVVFSGSQRAANAGCSMLSQRAPSTRSAPTDPVIVNGSDNTRISVFTTSGRRYLANSREENWPVKVTIHNINYEDMTLSGTMEAYNIPDKTSPTQDAHIVTFLEGEIIDFNKHTLETKNFKADADIDSTYWRELQPFKELTDSEIAKSLLSRRWVTERLANGWILMRWKERCFISPTDSRQGLTISGFYYISLRREDGHIEGLYYDPGSSPYQQLSLKPETVKMVRPSYTFR